MSRRISANDAESLLLRRVGRKGISKEKLAEQAAGKPELIQVLLNGLDDERAATRYGCAKVLRLMSERRPEALYPYFDSYIALLEHNNRIMNWEGLHVIGNLAANDHENRVDRILDRYLALITGPVMISAANAVQGAGKIARAKPYLADRIATAILGVEQAEYRTAECRNVATGHAIESLDRFFEHIRNQRPVVEFIKRQLKNTRTSTRKKAAQFLTSRHCY